MQETLFAKISDRGIVLEMEESYIDYAMSVIVARALPDVRDGLKPVHRRILYSMHELGLRSTSRFLKCARVVGDVLGKYHPHGDTAVYDAMARMAQDFAMRYQMVDGHGNFGSIDGDSPAAMRYTEARMQKIADAMLTDIEKDTVDFRDNYDGSQKEPSVLPAKIPYLLLNGVTGIAVGMATSIPPHNLTELIDGLIHLSDNPETSIEELTQFIKGPDFPTGGKIYDLNDIKNAYINGRGGIVMRAKAEIEDWKKDRHRIIVTEIPYQVNKSKLIVSIADLVKDKKITEISDLRDESNLKGIRIVIELKKNAYPNKVLNQLYKFTQLQTSFHMNMIALVDGIQPRLLNLKKVLEHFIDHRKVVIRRRTEYELAKAKARAHILEGLKIALDNIDEVIETIKKSETKEIAAEALMTKFKLSDKQADAILQMRLQTLAGLERQKIIDEYNELMKLIEELEAILADPQKIVDIMKKELLEMKEKYGDERRTEIIPHGLGKMTSKDTIPNTEMMVLLSKENYIKRLAPSTFKTQHRGGKGVQGGTTKDEDEIKEIFHTSNHNDLLFFTDKGKVYKLPVYEIPEASRTAKGQPIVNLLNLEKGEQVTSVLDVSKRNDKYLFMATKKGIVKKTEREQFKNIRTSGLIAINLKDNDSLDWVKQTSGEDQIMLVTQNGQSIRFSEKDVRAMGRTATGVIGIRLKGDDKVVEMNTVRDESAELLTISENGFGKTTKLSEYRAQNRSGSGIKAAKVSPKTGKIVDAKIIHKDDTTDLIIASKNGVVIRIKAKTVPSLGRSTQGVYIMRLKKGDKVSSMSIITQKTEEEKPESDKKAEQNEIEK